MSERKAFEIIRNLMAVITASPSLGITAEVIGAALEAERIASEQLVKDGEARAA